MSWVDEVYKRSCTSPARARGWYRIDDLEEKGNMGKPILCLDFDGVIHSYLQPWVGAAIIPDGPVDGAMEFLSRAVEQFEVHIYSSRSNQPGGCDAMCGWLRMHLYAACDSAEEAEHIYRQIQWPLDMTFTGTWPSLEDLRNFKPWYRK